MVPRFHRFRIQGRMRAIQHESHSSQMMRKLFKLKTMKLDLVRRSKILYNHIRCPFL